MKTVLLGESEPVAVRCRACQRAVCRRDRSLRPCDLMTMDNQQRMAMTMTTAESADRRVVASSMTASNHTSANYACM